MDASIINELSLFINSRFPEGAKRYVFHGEWYKDDDSKFSSKFFSDNNEVIGDSLSFDESFKLLDLAKGVANKIKENGSSGNLIEITFFSNGEYDVLVENDTQLDAKREAETCASIGDELYEKLEQERKDFKPTEIEVANPLINESMTTSQLLGYIHHELGEELTGTHWERLILDVIIETEEIEKSINTHFYYLTSDSEIKIEFEPENPIGPMNAVMLIRDRMTEKGDGWNKSTIILQKNGEVEFKF